MGHLLSAAAAEQNILDAWQRTLDRSHAEHIPAPEGERFRSELLRNLAAISTALRTMEWTPQPLRKATIPKVDGTRTLHIPTVADRIAERALAACSLEPSIIDSNPTAMPSGPV